MARYRRGELPEGRTDWEEVRRLQESGDRVEDPENPRWTREAFLHADLVTPGGLTREPVYIRMYKVVLDYYRSFGKGYQTRINDDLLDLVRKRVARTSRADPVRQQRVSVTSGTQWKGGRAAPPRAG
jgi:uncharacterized protein (DUF4415 family)